MEYIKKQKYVPDIKVNIELLTGEKLNITINPNDNVLDLKLMIQSIIGTSPDQMNLIFNRKQLKETTQITDTDIKDDVKILVVRKLRGGMFHSTSGRNGSYLPIRTCYFSLDTKSQDGLLRKPKKPTIIKNKYGRTIYKYE